MDTTKQIDVSRQVIPFSETLLKEQSNLGEIALKNRKKYKEIVSTKPEFKEYSKGAIKVKVTTAIAADYFVDGTAKAIDIETTENILVSDVLTFQTNTKLTKGDITLIVTEKVSDTQIKAQIIGGDNSITISVGDYIYVDTTAHPEGSKADKRRPMFKPRNMFNYSQIVRAGHSITGTLAEVNNYDFEDIKKELRRQSYTSFAQNLAGLVTSGVRNNLTIDGNEHRIAGGLVFYSKNTFDKDGVVIGPSTVNVKNVGGALTQSVLDDGFQYVAENGGDLDSIICSPAQARKISELNPEKVSVNVFNGEGTNPIVRGGATQILISPIDINGNSISKVYVDTRMTKDTIIMFNSKNVALIPMKNRATLENEIKYNATNDIYSLDVLGEWTVKFENAIENSFILTGLTV